MLIDRDEVVGDCICGGFLSWKTAAQLRALGCGPESLGAHPVRRLRLYAGDAMAETELVEPGFGLSRLALDTALREAAVAAGAKLEIDRARSVAPGCINGSRREWRSDAIFLATGKHDVRGAMRPRENRDPALGLRVRLPAGSPARALVGDAIELHLFPGGYAGIVVQEDGSTNVCLALRKSLLGSAASEPRRLLDMLAEDNSHFARRMEGADHGLPIDTIAAVPYGWIARSSEAGLYGLGDQAAVIPSLAGEGMSIALASAEDAVGAYLAGMEAPQYQACFARRARRPVGIAEAIWHLAEHPRIAAPATRLAGAAPWLTRAAMRLSRI